ncbi:MAG: hypothetical protein ACPH9J_04830, partial [Candidatus Poseidoniaceae archaeon]
GESSMLDGTLSVGAHSVTVIELDADVIDVPIYGCTDATATNYDASATENDGSCEYPPEPILGCTNSTASNFDPEATQDDGSCQYDTNPVDPCVDVFCDVCPAGWITLPAEEGECCPSCQEPIENNQTNTTNETDGNQSVSEEMKTCEGCCGNGFEVAIDEPCPVVDCAPCETEGTSDSQSSALTMTRSLLIGAVIIAALFLGLTGRKKGLQVDESVEIDWDDQEN